MLSALSALATWWLATPAAQALTADGALWFQERPESPTDALPYATYFLVSEPVTTWTTGYPVYTATVQINMHDGTPAEALADALALVQLLSKSITQPGGAPLVVGYSPVMHVLQDDQSVHIGEGLGPGGQDCWVAVVTFDIPWTP